MDLIKLLRSQKLKVTYFKPYDANWTDEKLLKYIIKLDCPGQDLKELPPLSNCRKLNCEKNQLTSLPDLPLCKTLWCTENKLVKLGKLPICKRLGCGHNLLTNLSEIVKCKELFCHDNPLPTFDLKEWQEIWASENKLVQLIKANKCTVKYNKPYDDKWDNQELLENIKESYSDKKPKDYIKYFMRNYEMKPLKLNIIDVFKTT